MLSKRDWEYSRTKKSFLLSCLNVQFHRGFLMPKKMVIFSSMRTCSVTWMLAFNSTGKSSFNQNFRIMAVRGLTSHFQELTTSLRCLNEKISSGSKKGERTNKVCSLRKTLQWTTAKSFILGEWKSLKRNLIITKLLKCSNSTIKRTKSKIKEIRITRTRTKTIRSTITRTIISISKSKTGQNNFRHPLTKCKQEPLCKNWNKLSQPLQRQTSRLPITTLKKKFCSSPKMTIKHTAQFSKYLSQFQLISSPTWKIYRVSNVSSNLHSLETRKSEEVGFCWKRRKFFQSWVDVNFWFLCWRSEETARVWSISERMEMQSWMSETWREKRKGYGGNNPGKAEFDCVSHF